MLKKLKSDSPSPVYRPVDLPRVRNEALARELDVRSQARRAARRELPEPECTVPDASEIALRHKLEARAQQAVSRIQAATSELRQQVRSATVSSEVTDIGELSEQFERQLAAELAPELAELEAGRKQLAAADDDLARFRERAQLERAADYPDSHWLTFALLAGALLIETALNGSLMASGHDFGLIGGSGQAFLISVLNIGLGFTAGLGVLRYKNHCQRALAWRMTALFLLLCLLALGFNWLLAHYREALLTDADRPWLVMEQALLSGQWLVRDFSSWLLLLTGLFFFSIAVFKGYRFDDEYPGYGRFARRRERCEALLFEVRDEALDKLDRLYQATAERLEQLYRQIVRKGERTGSSVSALDLQAELLRAHLHQLDKALYYLVSLYREVNASERSSPVPAYFSQPPDSLLAMMPQADYPDPRHEFTATAHDIGQQLPALRASLLKLKEAHHHLLDEACRR